jgi:pyrroloquinoline quinone biosynthesis protein B
MLAGCATVAPGVEVFVLGAAQDGGLPQLGCEAECCAAARADPARRSMRTSIGVRDGASGSLLLVEATADVEPQVALLHRLTGVTGRGRNPVDGILVTHAHVGHCLGLLSFGRETAASREVPLFCTERFAAFLSSSPPFDLLVRERHVVPRVVRPGASFEPIPGLTVEAIPVPHRDEFSDTVAFVLRGRRRSLLFLPDIDRFEAWDRDIEALVESVDVALLDGTFFEEGEVPGRSIAQIPHPLVRDTVTRLSALARRHPGRVVFIHMNHTNRLWRDESAVRDLEAKGFRVAREGDRFEL